MAQSPLPLPEAHRRERSPLPAPFPPSEELRGGASPEHSTPGNRSPRTRPRPLQPTLFQLRKPESRRVRRASFALQTPYEIESQRASQGPYLSISERRLPLPRWRFQPLRSLLQTPPLLPRSNHSDSSTGSPEPW